MDGIEILNKVDVLVPHTRAVMFIVFVGIVWALLFIMSAFIDGLVIHMYVCIGVLLITIVCTVAFGRTEPSGRYQYEVTIDDSVSFTKLYEKYEVVEQKGKIWILEDKEEVSNE